MESLYERIIKFLDESGVAYKEVRHDPVFTSEEAAAKRGSKLDEGAKALLFWADENAVQIVIQGDKKVDKDKFKELFSIKKLKMVSADEVKDISSVEPGAVPPFGNLFIPPIPVYCNKNFMNNAEHDMMEFNAGDHSISIRMKKQDWQNLVKPIPGDYEG